MEIHGLTPNEDYEFKVVAVDGDHETESAIEKVNTYGVIIGEVKQIFLLTLLLHIYCTVIVLVYIYMYM